jgi:nucleotide-binding universal stress UspA family protein
MLKRLLVCTDLSDGVYRLAQCVASLAEAGVQQVTFLHCVPLREEASRPVPDVEKMAAARDRLTTEIAPPSPDIQVQVLVESGKPLDAILRTATACQADLIVLGMPVRTSLAEKLFGSTTLGLCQKTPVPMLILRPQLIESYTLDELALRCRQLLRRLLIPFDGSEASQYLLNQVRAIAQQQSRDTLAACHLCWAIDNGGRVPKDAQVNAANTTLPKVQTELAALNVHVTAEVRLGTPVVEVLAAAVAADVSAIAVSSGTLGTVREWSMPSFTGELLRRSWRPLLYFPSAKS